MCIELKRNLVADPKTDALLSDIFPKRILMLKKSNYLNLERNTPNEAFGFLYLDIAVRSIRKRLERRELP
jgi:hypothetical protein